MANRYVRQFEFTNTIDSPACPVALEKGAVLLDTKTNTYYLQLKLANIGAVPVSSVKVYIEAFDGEGNPAYSGQTPGIVAEYNVLVPVGEAFGTKQLLPVPNNNAATFHVYIEQVTTNTGYVLAFPREQYTTGGTGRDISLERENALTAVREIHSKQVKTYLKMWGAKWYHVLFALWILVYLIWVL